MDTWHAAHHRPSDRTHLQLLLVQVHLLQLVPGGLGVPRPVVSLQEVEPQVAESLLQLLEGVAKLRRENTRRSAGGSNIVPLFHQTHRLFISLLLKYIPI